MALSPVQEKALARWSELGDTTPTNPILQMAYELYYQPMGVKADALRYDALAALENRESAQIELVAPKWSAARVDKEWSQAAALEPLMALSDYLAPVWAQDGTIEEFAIIKEADERMALKMEEFQDKYAEDIFDLSDALSQAAKLYIDAALESMIQDKKESVELAQQFVENPRKYAAVIFQLFTQPLPK